MTEQEKMLLCELLLKGIEELFGKEQGLSDEIKEFYNKPLVSKPTKKVPRIATLNTVEDYEKAEEEFDARMGYKHCEWLKFLGELVEVEEETKNEEQKTFILSDADVKNDEVCYGDYIELSEDESNIEATILNLNQMIALLTSLADEGTIKSVIHGELINKETTAGWKIYCKKGEKK